MGHLKSECQWFIRLVTKVKVLLPPLVVDCWLLHTWNQVNITVTYGWWSSWSSPAFNDRSNSWRTFLWKLRRIMNLTSLTYIWINISHTITAGLFIVVDSQNINHKLCGIKDDSNICIKFTDYKWPNLLGWIENRFFCGGQLNCESVSSINSPNQ